MAFLRAPGHAVPDGVLNEWLQYERGHHHAFRINGRVHLDRVVELLTGPCAFQFEVSAQRIQVVLQGNFGVARVLQDHAHQPRELGEVVAGLARFIGLHIRVDRVERVEDEVRVHLGAECLGLKKGGVFFEAGFAATAVEDEGSETSGEHDQATGDDHLGAGSLATDGHLLAGKGLLVCQAIGELHYLSGIIRAQRSDLQGRCLITDLVQQRVPAQAGVERLGIITQPMVAMGEFGERGFHLVPHAARLGDPERAVSCSLCALPILQSEKIGRDAQIGIYHMTDPACAEGPF